LVCMRLFGKFSTLCLWSSSSQQAKLYNSQGSKVRRTSLYALACTGLSVCLRLVVQMQHVVLLVAKQPRQHQRLASARL
jgi:hypothetical protein